ncbi:hypothetical protein EYF80_043788 [Liparis tanakae]|uniref:Uncharacterized protein n=1 Tax=Liparis tanakae TaxID=230148 RepID=A0A4Z2FXN3_9TELE|nr:hypothetical protein EYF80_043788 [Liparis tanakae]
MTGLEVPPADALPTGLECLGPRPGIFSPVDLSMFMVQRTRRSSSSSGGRRLCGRGTRWGSGGRRSPCLSVGRSGVINTPEPANLYRRGPVVNPCINRVAARPLERWDIFHATFSFTWAWIHFVLLPVDTSVRG